MTPEVNETIGEDRPPTLFCGVVAFDQNREIIFACSLVRATDAYHILIRSRLGAGEKARAPGLGYSYDGG